MLELMRKITKFIQAEEEFSNWMEYHIREDQIFGNFTESGAPLPDGFSTALWNDTWVSSASRPFGESVSATTIASIPEQQHRLQFGRIHIHLSHNDK